MFIFLLKKLCKTSFKLILLQQPQIKKFTTLKYKQIYVNHWKMLFIPKTHSYLSYEDQLEIQNKSAKYMNKLYIIN